MRIMFQINYEDVNGEQIETLSCVDDSDKDFRKIMHAMLDEYLDNNQNWSDKKNQFWVGVKCNDH